MKLSAKMLLPALALPLILAACGGTASNGIASVKVTNLKTEYRTATGKYVSCDNTTKLDGSKTTITSVGTYFTATGTLDTLRIGLIGESTKANNGNYSVDIPGNKLKSLGGSTYKTVFTADSSVGLLPQAIVVNPNPDVTIKTVQTVGDRQGGFYARLTLNPDSDNLSARSDQSIDPVIANIDVYVNCTVTAVTGDKL